MSTPKVRAVVEDYQYIAKECHLDHDEVMDILSLVHESQKYDEVMAWMKIREDAEAPDSTDDNLAPTGHRSISTRS